jgi:ubiquinone/menaquinone biosynthesis C-methylase UbiE
MDEHQRGQVATAAAEIYERFFVPALFAEWPRHVLAAAGVGPGDQVLDVACGTGVLARAAADRVGSDRVVGIDVNDGMLAVARATAPGIAWQCGFAEALPFEDDSFDRVVSQFGLMFFADRSKAISEMLRVVKPDGAVTVAVWGPLEATPGYAVVTEILTDLFGADVAESIRAPYSLGDPGELERLLTEAGADDITVRTITGRARFESVEAWIYTDIKGWTLADVIDDEGYELLRIEAPQRLSRFVLEDGSVAFDAPAHIATTAAP